MRAYELQSKPGLDSIGLSERADPRPGPGQVLIRLRAWSLNFRDLSVARGVYGGAQTKGLIPLSDGVGEIVEVGPRVTRVKAGDRVAGIFMQGFLAGGITAEALATALGGAIDGMLSEYAVLNEQGVVHVPTHLTDEEAATLPCAAVTAWNALVREARVKAGDSVLLLGTGGVSLFALQFAKMLGARVILTSSSDEKLSVARQLGADETINYKTHAEWDKAVARLTDGRGADVIVEVGGAGTLDKSLASVRVGGTICLIGVLAGVAGPVITASILRRHVRVQGIYVGSREMFEEMNRAITQHGLRPRIGKRFGFEEARGAYEYLSSGTHTGKVTIRI